MKVIDSTLIGFGKALMVPGAFFLKVGLEFWQRAALVTERFLSFRTQGSLAGESGSSALLSLSQPIFDLFLALGMLLAVIAFAWSLLNETTDLRSLLNPRDIMKMLTRLLITLFLVSFGMELALCVTDLCSAVLLRIPAEALSMQGSLDHLSGRIFERVIENAFFRTEGGRQVLDVESSGEAYAFAAGIREEIRDYVNALAFTGEFSEDGDLGKRSSVCPHLTLGELRVRCGDPPSPGETELSDELLRAWAALRPESFQKLWKEFPENEGSSFDPEREACLSFLRILRTELCSLQREREAALMGRLTSREGDLPWRSWDAGRLACLPSQYVSGMTVGELYLTFGSDRGFRTLGGFTRYASPADEEAGIEDMERMERFCGYFVSYLLEDQEDLLLKYGVFAGVLMSLKDGSGGKREKGGAELEGTGNSEGTGGGISEGDGGMGKRESEEAERKGGGRTSPAEWVGIGLLCFSSGLTLALAMVIAGFEILQASVTRIFRMFLILPMAPVSFAHLAEGPEGIRSGLSWLRSFSGYAAEAGVFATAIRLSFALMGDFAIDSSGMGALEMTVVELISTVMPVISAAGLIRGAENSVRDILGSP